MAAGARVNGSDATLEAAAHAAARLLAGARQPLVAGLGADIAGVSAALSLARRLGGVADHAHAGAVLRDLDVMRRSGWIVTTPLEARARADLVVLVGPGLEGERDDLALVLDGEPRFQDGLPRKVLRVCPDDGGAQLLGQLGQLRMLLAGRKPEASQAVRAAADALRAARYGVIAWSAAHLGDGAVEMICGIVDALNATSRCAGLPLAAAGNAAGAVQAAAWLTGYPLPVGFGRGFPEHDPWRFDAARLVEAGESDAALWVMALDPVPPPWTRPIGLVALIPAAAKEAPWVQGAQVSVVVGRPGEEHDAVLHDPRLSALAARTASAPTASAPTVADVIEAIAAALPSC